MVMINKCDKILDKISGEVDALIVVQRRIVKVEILDNTPDPLRKPSNYSALAKSWANDIT